MKEIIRFFKNILPSKYKYTFKLDFYLGQRLYLFCGDDGSFFEAKITSFYVHKYENGYLLAYYCNHKNQLSASEVGFTVRINNRDYIVYGSVEDMPESIRNKYDNTTRQNSHDTDGLLL